MLAPGGTVPHLTVHAVEVHLTGREDALIAALTDAVAAVYGEWARELVVVELLAVPPARWGVGGVAADRPAPRVDVGVRQLLLDRPDAPQLLERLAAGVTDAVTGAVGDGVRDGLLVEFRAQRDDRTALGGRLLGR